MLLVHTPTHTHSHPHTHAHTLTHTPTHPHTLTPTHTHTHINANWLSCKAPTSSSGAIGGWASRSEALRHAQGGI